MKKKLFILLSLSILYSCTDNQKEDKVSASKILVLGFNITSKNSDLTLKRGTDISINDMITKNVNNGDNIEFKSYQFTLDNKIKDAFNFYSYNGALMCNIPTNLSVMSMPPDGNGLVTYEKGDDIELQGVTLIKLDSINFVISDIRINNLEN